MEAYCQSEFFLLNLICLSAAPQIIPITFLALPNAIGIAGFGALTNTGEPVILQDQFGNVVDSLEYDLTWYRDSEKQDGGYSLELVNPTLPCSGSNNWVASTDASGGTPAAQNSVFSDLPDETPPAIQSHEILSSTQIVIYFNEPIATDSFDPENFTLAENEIESVEAQAASP